MAMQEKGENTWKDAERHADAWIRANRETFDGWIAEAKRAVEQTY
jgi:glycine betaine/proline transport system substrate-binding protein